MPQTYQEDTQHRGEFISGADAKTLIGRWFGKLFFDDTWPSDNAGYIEGKSDYNSMFITSD
jgi:hypothetical protein